MIITTTTSAPAIQKAGLVKMRVARPPPDEPESEPDEPKLGKKLLNNPPLPPPPKNDVRIPILFATPTHFFSAVT